MASITASYHTLTSPFKNIYLHYWEQYSGTLLKAAESLLKYYTQDFYLSHTLIKFSTT